MCKKTSDCSGNEQCVTLNPNEKPPKFYNKAVKKFKKMGTKGLTTEERNIVQGCGYLLNSKGCCHDPKDSKKWIAFKPGEESPNLRALTFDVEPIKQKTPVKVLVSSKKSLDNIVEKQVFQEVVV